MPGVVVETYTNPGPAELLRALGSSFFVAGLTERGDTTGVLTLRSLSDYTDQLGDRVSYGTLFDQVKAYFAEGGTRCYVARLVGDAATVGTLTLEDQAGTPVDTLRIDAANAGAWSSRVKIAVAAGAVADTFTITVLYDDEPVEVFANLANPAAAVIAMATSSFVRATNLSSATAAPDNNPAVLAATALSAGADDRASLVAADYVAALERFTREFGPGVIAIPGFDSSLVGAGLIAHARERNRLAALATTQTATPSQAEAAALAFVSTPGAEHAGLFYPWVKVDDGVGSTRSISPEGYVAGVRARAHVQAGPWRAPAGEIAIARSLAGLERGLTRAEGDDLNDGRVNAIRTIGGTLRLYGWRSLSVDTVNYRLLTGRDVMNEVAGLGERRLERFVFGTVDGRGHFQRQLEAEMTAILEPMRTAGGLYERTDPETGQSIDNGYTVDAGPGVNTPERLANDEVAVDVALRVSPAAELIRLRITKVAFTVAL